MARSPWRTMVSAALALAIAAPVHAQGKRTTKGNGHKSTPPSSTPLPTPTSGPAAVVTPLAWLDDATVLPPGTASLTISSSRWTGSDLSEVDVPVVEAAVGLAPRVQIGASVPHIVGSADGTGPVGGVGTSYFTTKIALLTGGSGVKLAVSPMLEVLGESAVQALPSNQTRTQVGLPVSIEIPQGAARFFASTGVFSQGVWFAGGGVSLQATARVGVSLTLSRAWATDTTTGGLRDRRDLSGAASYFVKPNVAVYGALSRTIATSDDSGAGTTMSGGVSILFTARVTR